MQDEGYTLDVNEGRLWSFEYVVGGWPDKMSDAVIIRQSLDPILLIDVYRFGQKRAEPADVWVEQKVVAFAAKLVEFLNERVDSLNDAAADAKAYLVPLT